MKLVGTLQPYAPGVGLGGSLDVCILANGRTVKLLRPFIVRSLGRRIEAPAGMMTDFLSIPRIFWRIWPPWGRYSPATVIHDWLYQSGNTTRTEADRILLDLCRRLAVPGWQCRLIYWGVRLGGWRTWRKYRGKERTDTK